MSSRHSQRTLGKRSPYQRRFFDVKAGVPKIKGTFRDLERFRVVFLRGLGFRVQGFPKLGVHFGVAMMYFGVYVGVPLCRETFTSCRAINDRSQCSMRQLGW